MNMLSAFKDSISSVNDSQKQILAIQTFAIWEGYCKENFSRPSGPSSYSAYSVPKTPQLFLVKDKAVGQCELQPLTK